MLDLATMSIRVSPPTSERFSVTGVADSTEPTVVIRPVDRADAPALAEFYAALPDDDRRRRFLGSSRGPGLGFCESLCTNDHVHGEGFVAVLGTTDAHDGRIVGHLCLVPDDTSTPEIGIAVASDHQGRGIGRRLFERALGWARAQGVRTLRAVCFADNARVLRLLSSAHGASIFPTCDPAIVEIEIRVAAADMAPGLPASTRTVP
jgi:GNAT superfamily N-acetyltransferase